MKEYLAQLIEQAGIDIPASQQQQLLGYVEMLNKWNKAYNALDKKFSDQDISPEVEQLIEEIREHSFAVAEQGTEGHELASSISDDFELFARSIVLEFFDPFLESMWEVYENGEIPNPENLTESED